MFNGITGTILFLSAKEGTELKIKELEKQLKDMDLGIQKIKDSIAKSRE